MKQHQEYFMKFKKSHKNSEIIRLLQTFNESETISQKVKQNHSNVEWFIKTLNYIYLNLMFICLHGNFVLS